MQDNISNNKRIARNTFFLYIRMALVMLVSLYTSRVILQVLGVVDFGVYNVVAGFVSMFAFLNTSLTACIQRYYNYEIGKYEGKGFQNVYITAFYIQLFLAITVFLLVESAGLWYLKNRLVIPDDRLDAAYALFHFSTISMIFVIMQVPYSAAVLSKERMDFYALVGIIDILLKLIIVIIIPYFSFDKLVLYGFLLLFVSFVDFLLFLLYTKLNFPELKLKFYFDKHLFKSMMLFSGWSTLGSFAQVIRNQGLNIVLNIFFGPVVNAARGISYQVRAALASFMSQVPTAARPQLTESYSRGNIGRSIRIMYSISKISFFLIYLMALPIIYEMDFLIHLWLGNNVPDYTVIFSQIILIIAIIETFNWPVSMIIYASGKIGWYNIITSIIGLVVLPLCYFALKIEDNPVLVYVISLLISIAVQTASLFCMRAVVGIKVMDYIRKVLGPSSLVVIFTFFIPFIIIKFLEQGFIRFSLVFISFLVFALIVCYYVGLNRHEKKLLVSFIDNLFIKFRKNGK